MATIRTLNQILTEFETFATNHYQINSFDFGQPSEIAASKQVQYPAMWVTPPSKITTETTKEYTFGILIGDITKPESAYIREVLSDTDSILSDFLDWLDDEHQELNISSGSDASVWMQKDDDNITGWFINVTVILPRNSNTCAIPRAA